MSSRWCGSPLKKEDTKECTEKKIMNQIYQVSQNKTLIVVAHRLSTIKVCDKIIEMKDGQLIC